MKTKNTTTFTEATVVVDLEAAIFANDADGIIRALNQRAALPMINLAARLVQAEADVETWRARARWTEAKLAEANRAWTEAKTRKGFHATDERNTARIAGTRAGDCSLFLTSVERIPEMVRAAVRATAAGDSKGAGYLIQRADKDLNEAASFWQIVDSAEKNAGRPIVLPGAEAVKAA